jgi:electron transfer flavoprotein alpha subunit
MSAEISRREIWVVAEHRGGELKAVTAELLGEGKKLAGQFGGGVRGVLLGYKIRELASSLARYGADSVYLAEHELLADYSVDAFVTVLHNLILRYQPFLLLLGATPQGREIAPRLAVRLGAPLVTQCISLDKDKEGRLVAVRPAYQDKVYQTVLFPSAQFRIATLLPGVRDAEFPDVSREAEVIDVQVKLSPEMIRPRHLGFLPADPRTVDIAEAEKVIAGGRGMGSEGSFQQLWELADLLGAAVAGTRVAVDRGWLPLERMVGTTGKSVHPRLYFAWGISGASQHVAGMKDSEKVIAVNNDPGAPLFSLADLGVLGDVQQVLPALIARLRCLSGLGWQGGDRLQNRT